LITLSSAAKNETVLLIHRGPLLVSCVY
jgi:hypothetical protein